MISTGRALQRGIAAFLCRNILQHIWQPWLQGRRGLVSLARTALCVQSVTCAGSTALPSFFFFFSGLFLNMKPFKNPRLDLGGKPWGEKTNKNSIFHQQISSLCGTIVGQHIFLRPDSCLGPLHLSFIKWQLWECLKQSKCPNKPQALDLQSSSTIRAHFPCCGYTQYLFTHLKAAISGVQNCSDKSWSHLGTAQNSLPLCTQNIHFFHPTWGSCPYCKNSWGGVKRSLAKHDSRLVGENWKFAEDLRIWGFKTRPHRAAPPVL